jgi:hypothetical protein
MRTTCPAHFIILDFIPLVIFGCYYGLRYILRSRPKLDQWYSTDARAGRTLTKKEEEKLSIVERKILRKIYGPSCVNGVWRIKYHDELYNIYKELSIVKMIKISRLKWSGHVARMEDNAPCKKITFSQPEGSRKKGRPKLRWPDSVLKDLKMLTVTA